MMNHQGLPFASASVENVHCCAACKADAVLVTALDEIAWLFNLRGSDVSYNPVFLSYAIVSKEGATLYVDSEKVRIEAMHGALIQSKLRKMMKDQLTNPRTPLLKAVMIIFWQPS